MKQIFISVILFLTVAGLYAQHGMIPKSGITPQLGSGFMLYNGINANADFTLKSKKTDGVSIYYLHAKHAIKAQATDAVGIFFNNLVNTNGQVVLWRYKPWLSWTKPITLKTSVSMPDNDVQFFYWRYKDGTYGAAVPMSGNGFRTTLGKSNNKWGSKAVRLNASEINGDIPSMAVAFGTNPYDLFAKIYAVALKAMGKGDNLRTKKQFPEPLNYLGWCTYNALSEVNAANIIAAVKSFTEHNFPLKMVLIDGGWYQTNNGQLMSQFPDTVRFPGGFKPMNDHLKRNLGIKYMGIWHDFNGHVYGIDPKSELGIDYKNDLFSWTQGVDGKPNDTTRHTYHFIKPGAGLDRFFDSWYSYFKQQGFDFTKVDNQSVTERMTLNNFPIFTSSEQMHRSLYNAADKYLHGDLINCMDMTAEDYLNFGSSPVARTVEDYFPYHKGEDYNMQKGNAAAHVLQGIYNSLYFTQMVYPDFDMFDSNNPNAEIHAVARALTCGPIYVTDKPGQQNFDVLNALAYHDGRTVRSQNPLLPTADCLFQVQGKKIFKAFTTVGNTGLLDIYNAADADHVAGTFRAADVDKIQGNDFVIYEHFSKEAHTAKRNQVFHVALPRLGYKLYYIVALKNGFAPLGLTKKYNAPATIISQIYTTKKVTLTLYEGGEFKAYSVTKPRSVSVNGITATGYLYKNNMLSMVVPSDGDVHPVVTFRW